MVTIQDVARKAGVSIAAVSLVVNDPATKRVSEGKRQLIQKVVAELGYQPNGHAKALSTRATRIVGLFAPMPDTTFQSTFNAEMLSGVQNALRDAGYDLMIYSHAAKSAKLQPRQIARSRFVDGVIFSNTRMCSQADIDDTIDELTVLRTPFVMVNSYTGDRDIDYVGVDNAAIGRMAATYLAGKGHRRIAMLLGSRRAPAFATLRKGFVSGLRSVDASIPAPLFGYGEYSPAVEAKVVGEWMQLPERPTAIFCADDQMAPALYDILRELRLAIPQDVAVLSRAGLPFTTYLTPKLSTIAIPIADIGYRAAELLVQRLQGKDIGRQKINLPCRLIERESI